MPGLIREILAEDEAYFLLAEDGELAIWAEPGMFASGLPKTYRSTIEIDGVDPIASTVAHSLVDPRSSSIAPD